MSTTKTEGQDSYRERASACAAQGVDFYPALKSPPKQEEWEQVFDCHEGRIGPSRVSERCRTLAGAPMTRILREAIHWDRGGVTFPPANDPETFRTFFESLAAPLRTRSGGSGGNAAAAFKNRIGAWVLDGFNELQDSLDGIAATRELPNFLPAPIVQARDEHSLKPLAKGGTAEHIQLAVVDFGDWNLVRFAARASIDEQELVNDIPGAIAKNLAQLGRAAKRTWLDLAWSTVLSNPTLDQDGIALFEADTHANFTTGIGGALSDGAIGAACAAIRRQVVIADDGSEGARIQHINLRPRFLVIPPELETTARRALRLMKLDDPDIDLELRIESRLTDIGVRNPLTGTTVVGRPTNWLVTCDNSVAPWLLQGILQGAAEPKIRAAEFGPDADPGAYGLGVDISWNIACKAADFRGAYFANPSQE